MTGHNDDHTVAARPGGELLNVNVANFVASSKTKSLESYRNQFRFHHAFPMLVLRGRGQ